MPKEGVSLDRGNFVGVESEIPIGLFRSVVSVQHFQCELAAISLYRNSLHFIKHLLTDFLPSERLINSDVMDIDQRLAFESRKTNHAIDQPNGLRISIGKNRKRARSTLALY